MKFDIDCVRDILLAVESVEFNKTISLGELSKVLTDYTADEITYNCLKLYEANYLHVITKRVGSATTVVRIVDITYEGHQFLANIREATVWDQVKKKCHAIGSFSIPVIQEVASSLLKSFI